MRRDRSLVPAPPAGIVRAPLGAYRSPPIRVEVQLPPEEPFDAEAAWREALAAGPSPLRGAARAVGTVAYLGGCLMAGFLTGGKR
ncbi:hypothetical protein [Sorangium sp. So ce233]|uniref:hypothetical protein n=1 Tax=Sorangium sp. So ce233 TaxID=3133290 RepID=UPI003F5FDCB2